MKRILWGALAALCVLRGCDAVPAFAQTGYVTMTASNLTDQSGSGAPISNATACFQLVNGQGTPIGVHIGSSAGGQAAPRQACGPVNNGALVGTWQTSDPTAAGTNMVPDPAIANAWTTWSNPGSAWAFGSGSWITNAGNVDLLEAGAGASGLYQTSQSAAITVVPGQIYTISGYIDATNASGGDPAWLVSNAGGTWIVGAYQSPGVAGWVQAQFTVPAGITSVYVEAATRSVTIASGQYIHWAAPLLQAGSARLIDTNLSNPQNPCYQLTITDNTSGNVDLGGPGSGYSCLQPQWTESSPMSCVAGVCNLDSYVPTGTPGVVQTAGPVGPTGPGANFRGNWAASTAYAQGDVYNEAGTAYVVTSAYTSGSTYGSTDTSHNSTFNLTMVDLTARTALTGSADDSSARMTAAAALPLSGGNPTGPIASGVTLPTGAPANSVGAVCNYAPNAPQNVKCYGAQGSVQSYTNCSISAASHTLSCPSAALTSNMNMADVAMGPQGVATGTYASGITATGYAASVFTGSITGTTLTVTAITSGGLGVGQVIAWAGNGQSVLNIIAALGTGTGGTGTYTLQYSQTALLQTMGAGPQHCHLTFATPSGGSPASADLYLSGTNTIASGGSLYFRPDTAGSGYTSAPTTATASNGSATCSGTATVATAIYPLPVETAATYASPTTMTLTAAATTAVSSGNATVAVNDTTAFSNAIAAACAGGQGSVYFPAGDYGVTGLTIPAACALTFYGDGGTSTTGGWFPSASPFLKGSILWMMTPNVDALADNNSQTGSTLHDFGVVFDPTMAFWQTGHGIDATATTATNWGSINTHWWNLSVFGTDGNHYAYFLNNSNLNTLVGVNGYGGGCVALNANTQSAGNATLVESYCIHLAGGTAHGYFIGGPTKENLVNMYRPQVNVFPAPSGFSGWPITLVDTTSSGGAWPAPGDRANHAFYADQNQTGIGIDGPDLEGNFNCFWPNNSTFKLSNPFACGAINVVGASAYFAGGIYINGPLTVTNSAAGNNGTLNINGQQFPAVTMTATGAANSSSFSDLNGGGVELKSSGHTFNTFDFFDNTNARIALLGTGGINWSSSGSVSAGGYISNSTKVMQTCGTITTTTGSSDESPFCGWLSASSSCSVTSTNSTAATMMLTPPGIYVTIDTTNLKVQLFHGATAGATFSTACTNN